MSEKKDIEKLFKDALGKSGARPPEGSKDDIRKKLIASGLLKDDNSSKRIFFWIIGIASIAIMSVTAGYFMNDKNKNLTQAITSPEQNNKAAAIVEKEKNNNRKQTDSFPLSRAEIQKNLSEISVKQDEKTTLNKKENNSIGGTEKTKPVLRGNGKDNPLAENNFVSKPEEDEKRATEGNQNDKQDEKIQKPEAQPGSATVDTSSEPAVTSPGIERVLKQNELPVNESKSNTDTAKTDEKKNDLIPSSVSKEKNRKRFSIDLSGAARIYSFSYQSSNADFQSLAEESKKSESEKISFSAGIGVNIPCKNFFAEPGINYSFLKSDFSHVITQISIDTSGSHYIYENKDTVIGADTIPYHADSAWIKVSDTLNVKIPIEGSNKISVLEIPLWIGYTWSAGKFDIELKAGASVSFITSVNVILLSPSSERGVVHYDNKNSRYRKNYYSLLAGASLIFNINKRYSVFLQPDFKYSLGSIYKNYYPVSKKIQSISLGAGWRINF